MDIQKTVKEANIHVNGYVEWTGNSCASLESKQLDNIHMLLGMSTEIGELQDVFKKNIAYGTKIDWINVREEIGDIMFYVASFCRINNFDLDTILGVNMAKLMSRYPEKFDKWRANNRDLDKERKILENDKKEKWAKDIERKYESPDQSK